MFKKRVMNLHVFDDAGDGGNGSLGSNQNAGTGNGTHVNAGTYTFEQAEEIATARAQRAEQAALRSYFQQQGMSREEVESAILEYRQKKASQQPNVTEIEKQRDDVIRENQRLKNSNHLRDKGVRADDIDYVLFKIEKLVDDKTDFKKAAEKYLKENPKFTSNVSGYKVTTSSGTTGNGSGGNMNDTINNAIRIAARK